MAVAVDASGTITSTTSGDTLRTATAAAAYELHVDCNAHTTAETIVIRFQEAVLSAGTVRSIQETTVTSGAAPQIKVLGPYACDQGCVVTLTRSTGSARAYPWKLLRL
jgi:hypothetical protein